MLQQQKHWQQKMPTVEPPPFLEDVRNKETVRKIFDDEPNPKTKLQAFERLSKSPFTQDSVSPPEGYAPKLSTNNASQQRSRTSGQGSERNL